jgi:hypothetical protein
MTSQQLRPEMSQQRLLARRSYDKHFKFNGTRLGAVTDALYHAGGDELMSWLAKNTPPGATIADTLAAIVTDAMHEEEDQ